MTPWWSAIHTIKKILEENQINYCFVHATALKIQQLSIEEPSPIEVSIQWDQLELAHSLFKKYLLKNIHKTNEKSTFTIKLDGEQATFLCYYNHVVATDKDRVSITKDGELFFVKSIDSFLHSSYRDAVISYLKEYQLQINKHNKKAWSTDAYAAWVQRFGNPQHIASKIKSDPEAMLTHLLPYFSHIDEKKIINLLGSNGLKAIALACLGAETTVVDISQDNARYAREVAEYANVPLHYIVSDVLNLQTEQLSDQYDVVLMERGILHYFIYLTPLFDIVYKLLKPGGQLILEDFHPFTTKLIKSSGKKHKVVGNYFDSTITKVPIAFGKHLNHQTDEPFVYEKYWTLGDMITSVAEANLVITKLDEKPNIKKNDIGIPKTFTLLARKPHST